jgi:gas vesicle protein
MGRFVYGTLVGGVAMYLLDPESGAERRRRLTEWWRQNRGPMTRAGQATARRIEDLKPAAEQVTRSAAQTAQTAASKVRPGRERSGWEPPEPVKRRSTGGG